MDSSETCRLHVDHRQTGQHQNDSIDGQLIHGLNGGDERCGKVWSERKREVQMPLELKREGFTGY